MEKTWKQPQYIGYILPLYWDNGKLNGNYYLGFRVSGLGFRGLGVQGFGSRG